MCKKISNNIEKDILESTFKAEFVHGSLYTKQSVINGAVESSLSIITQENPKHIIFAIWGILPSTYQDEWAYFQSVYDTLNCTIEELNRTDFFKNCLQHKRCLILASGFFVYHLKDGVLYPYYVSHKDDLPLSLGGVYTQLEDGFLTTTIIMKESDPLVGEIQNMQNLMPLIISEENRENWLDTTATKKNISQQVIVNQKHQLKAHPVAREFFMNNIIYDTILDPINYDGIPKV